MTINEAIRIIKIVLVVTEDFKITVQGEEFTKEKCKEAVEIVTEALSSSEKPNKWIPVSERLPEEREWYLAVFKEIDTRFQLIPRVADYIGSGRNEWRLIDEDGLVQEYRDILECVAWMPLPEPYKESSTEAEGEE